jgi:hypothetical protein
MPERGGKPSLVMAGLVPAIHVFLHLDAAKTWMPATSHALGTAEGRTRGAGMTELEH